jgi:hypothetical protein
MREHVKQVAKIIDDTLALCSAAGFRESLRAVIQGRLASADANLPWLGLPIFTCEALGGDIERAYHLAAGFEVGRIAAGCLDEWQDHDTEEALWQTVGPEQTVNLAVGMIALSFLTVTRLADLGVEPALVLALRHEFETTLLHMSAGQHADLSNNLSLDDYQAVAGAKSGALLRLGCRTGAIAAGASAETVERYGDFGYDLGILVQVWNDMFGLAGLKGKKDAEQQRALPILASKAVEPDLKPDWYRPETTVGQTGQLYAVLQLGILHQRTAEALTKCPATGSLSRFLHEYDPSRLVEILGQSHVRTEGNDEPQAV